MPKTRRQPAPGDLPAVASSRERILRAAQSLFARKGYENASTAAIARQAGTSESQLMKHFGSKEGLLEAIFDDTWKRINATAGAIGARTGNPAQKLVALVEAVAGALERDPEVKLLMLLEGRRVRKEGHMVLLTEGFRAFVRTLDGVLQEIRAAGQLRPGLRVEAVRSALMGAFEGLLRDLLLAQRTGYPARYNAREARAAFQQVLQSFLAPGAQRRRR